PMAGKEKVKLEQAEAELFKGKTYILTPTKKTDKKALAEIEKIVGLLGGVVLKLEPSLHDRVVAAISHMPLAIAASLANAVAGQKNGQREMKLCAASGFRDTTRIASGDPILGVDMFASNSEAVLEMITAFKESLSELENAIKDHNTSEISKLLKAAKNFRDGIYT
ncbi:MAG: prephenate dehydrogenase/arogenate dehydrogenase family protein, partial [bacterium]